jgi:putative transcriptional regulator
MWKWLAPGKPEREPSAMAKRMPEYLNGKFLIAMPAIGDPRFHQSVIFICAHDSEHAMGLIVNKPHPDLTMGDLLEPFGVAVKRAVAPKPVFDGGPVTPDRGFVLHSPDYESPEGSREVGPGMRLTTTRDVLSALGQGKTPTRALFALGYAGWSAGQLEFELTRNAWLVAPGDSNIVFHCKPKERWAAALNLLGIDPGQLDAAGGSA